MIEIIATLLQLFGGIFLAIDACLRKETYEKFNTYFSCYIENNFTPIDDNKIKRFQRLLAIQFVALMLSIAITKYLPIILKTSIYFTRQNIDLSMIIGFGVIGIWIFFCFFTIQTFYHSWPGLAKLPKYYLGKFLLYSEKGPIYVLGFAFLVAGYLTQLYTQIHI